MPQVEYFLHVERMIAYKPEIVNTDQGSQFTAKAFVDAIARELPIIGSGEIESAHRYIARQRLKRPGAWWRAQQMPNTCWHYASIEPISNGTAIGLAMTK